MDTSFYKCYSILTVGLSRYVFRPGQVVPLRDYAGSPGYAQTLAGAKEWIRQDISKGHDAKAQPGVR